MTKKDIIDKMHLRFDGELPPEEMEKLDQFLARNPEYIPVLKEMEQIHHQLEGTKDNLQTIDIKKEVLNRINMEAYTTKEKKQEIRVIRSFWSRPVVKFGFVFVAGVLAGLLVFSFLKLDLTGSKVDSSEVKGTFYDSRSFSNMKTADVLQYESPLAKAVCNVRYSSKVVEIRLDLSSLYPVKATIEFDFNNFELMNSQNLVVNDQTSAIAAANFIQINNVGDNKFIFQLYNKNTLPHNLEFKIYQNEVPIYQNNVQVNKE